VVVSPQLEKYSRQVARKHNLTFPVLADRGNRVAAQFGLTFPLPDDLKALYQKVGIDLVRFNGDDSGVLAMPGRFIVDPSGTIVDAAVDPNYTKRPEPEEIVTILKTRS
jgi:peroxiredoxin